MTNRVYPVLPDSVSARFTAQNAFVEFSADVYEMTSAQVVDNS